MEPFDPLTSVAIDPKLLRDHASVRERSSGKPYSLITTKSHPSLPLEIHNYTNRAFSRQKWDALAVASRTLITETQTGAVVSRSFSKFFNYNEKLAYKPTGSEHAFAIEEKVDGSIVSLFHYRSKWHMASRSSFNSPHSAAAMKILDDKYPSVLKKLDRDKTYVFEFIDPTMPIKVRYKVADLVLLSIIGKDGAEPPANFDWSILPFPRPRSHQAASVDPKELRKLNLDNEEGFVVKFWRTAQDLHPQRIKVKFDSYLQALGSSTSAVVKRTTLAVTDRQGRASNLAHTGDIHAFKPVHQGPTSNAGILAHYLAFRENIPTFKPTSVADRMEGYRSKYIDSLEVIADDYGGEAWLRRVEEIWDGIDGLVGLQEAEWRKLTALLEKESFKAGAANAATRAGRTAFERRISRNDIDCSYRNVLLKWFHGAPPAQVVKTFVESLSIPRHLRSSEVIMVQQED